jgi:trimeric autotransporter adhesin
MVQAKLSRIGETSADLDTYAVESNNNLFFAGTPSVNNLIFTDTVTNLATLPGYKRFVASRDSSSLRQNPPFISTIGSSSMFLHIDPTIGTQVESGGISVADITVDYDGNTRAATPDIGADEFAGLTRDLTEPSISYTGFTQTGLTTNRILSVSVTDPSGIATGGLSPRIYFKKTTDASYVSTQCVLAVAPNYNCTINNTLVGGGSVGLGVIIQYFVAAQDAAGNLSSNPSEGFAGTDVNTVTSPPTTPDTYIISATFTGSYSVGKAETITSLTNADGLFAKMNAGTISGNVTINLTSDLTAETGTVSLNQQVEDLAGNWTLTFKPSSSPRLISGSAESCLVNLNGADRVTFDGAFTGTSKDTTLSNTNTAGATVCFVNAATNNTVKNSIIKGVSIESNGVVVFSTVATGIIGNNNNTIENNDISGGATATSFGVLNSGTYTAKNSANLIKKNRIFDFSTAGIRDNGNSVGNIYTQNEIFEATTQTTYIYGFQVVSPSIDGFTFSRNFIHDLNTTFAGAVIGIHLLDTSTVATSEISNNMITLSAIAPLTLRGIWDQSGIGQKYNLFYNSVYIGGTVTGTSSSDAYFWNAISTTTAKNNIFMNARRGGTGKHYAFRTNTELANLTSDYNDIYATGGTGNVFGNNGAVDVPDLATWKLAPTVGTGKDANSVSGNPLFVNPLNNLHILYYNLLLRDKGTPVSVLEDFDGQIRSVVGFADGVPDIGADEAANASVRGRVVTRLGKGLLNATVILTNTNTGEVSYARTTSLGYFNFKELPTGTLYVINVNSKRYLFNSQSFTLTEDLTDLVLTGY